MELTVLAIGTSILLFVVVAVSLVMVGRGTGKAQRALAERDLARSERSRVEGALAQLRQALEGEQRQRVAAETRLCEYQRQLEFNTTFIADSRQQLEGTYAKLSHDALSAAVDQLVHVVRPHLDGNKGEIVSSLDTKKAEIEAMLTPMREMLDRYRLELRGTEDKRIQDYTSVQEQIRQLLEATEATRKETSKVASALGNPKSGGNWGELALRRCVEIAGLSEHCDFDVQRTFENEDEKGVRPDMAIRLPGDRVIFVDAKVPLEHFQLAMAEPDEKRRSDYLSMHARSLKRHVEELSRRKYPTTTRQSVDFTVLFVGGDQFLSAALSSDPSLYEASIGKNVLLASPTLLVPILRIVSSVWRAEKVEENARMALEIGQELYDRFVNVFVDLEGVGKSLNASVGKYNEAIRSIDKRLVPKAKELFEHVSSRKEIPDLVQIEGTTLESTKMPGGTMRLPIRELQQEEMEDESEPFPSMTRPPVKN